MSEIKKKCIISMPKFKLHAVECITQEEGRLAST